MNIKYINDMSNYYFTTDEVAVVPYIQDPDNRFYAIEQVIADYWYNK